MLKNRNFGITAVIVGVVINNFAYLIDLTRAGADGYIYFGPKAIAGAIVGIVVILFGLWVMMRAQTEPS